MTNECPVMRDEVRQLDDENGYSYLMLGEKKMRINQTGKKIIDLMDNNNNISKICRIIYESQSKYSYEDVQEMVGDFIFNLWKDGNFLTNDINIYMGHQYLSYKNYMFLPFQMEIPKQIKKKYLSPIINTKVASDPEKLQEYFKFSMIKLVIFDEQKNIETIFLFNTFGHFNKLILIGIFGKEMGFEGLDIEKVKNSWVKCMNNFYGMSMDTSENIEIIIYHIKSLIPENIFNYNFVGNLSREIDEKDLEISSMIL